MLSLARFFLFGARDVWFVVALPGVAIVEGLTYTDAESVSLNVGFYAMANAAGRLVGTLLSGALFLVGGLQACLWASCLLVALAFLSGIPLPPPLRQQLEAA